MSSAAVVGLNEMYNTGALTAPFPPEVVCNFQFQQNLVQVSPPKFPLNSGWELSPLRNSSTLGSWELTFGRKRKRKERRDVRTYFGTNKKEPPTLWRAAHPKSSAYVSCCSSLIIFQLIILLVERWSRQFQHAQLDLSKSKKSKPKSTPKPKQTKRKTKQQQLQHERNKMQERERSKRYCEKKKKKKEREHIVAIDTKKTVQFARKCDQKTMQVDGNPNAFRVPVCVMCLCGRLMLIIIIGCEPARQITSCEQLLSQSSRSR